MPFKPAKPKPNDLVVVRYEGATESGYWTAIGQVVSYPTPDDTVMVRRVPGDPGTMEEMSLKRLFQPYGKSKWVQYARVSGYATFPVDMLRYDRCVPVNFTLVECVRGNISIPMGWEPRLTNFEDGGLIVGRAVDYKTQPWTTERWNSYGWTVNPLKSLKIERV